MPPIIAEVAEDFVSACVLRDQFMEQLETIGPLTARGIRRAAMDLYLATSARIERSSVQLGVFRDDVKGKTHAPVNLFGVKQIPTSALHLAQDLFSRLARGEVLTEREHGQLHILQSAMRVSWCCQPMTRCRWRELNPHCE